MLQMKGSATEPVSVVVTPYTRFKGRGVDTNFGECSRDYDWGVTSICQSFKANVGIVLCSCLSRLLSDLSVVYQGQATQQLLQQ
jgi:hypothetical protein